MDVVRTDGLEKRRGAVEVLRGVDLTVTAGSVTAVIGENGAGKTTLLRILVGLARPTAGSATVLGHAAERLGPAERARLAFVPERPVFPAGLRVAEVLALAASLHPRWDQKAATGYLRRFAIDARRPADALSPSLRTLCALAVALATRPDLLVLDEPAAGLDPVMRRRYLQLLLDETAVQGRTVVLASQDLALVERLCDRIALLHDGRIQVAGALDAVLHAERRLRIAADAEARAALAAVPGVRRVEPMGRRGFVATGTVTAEAVRHVTGLSAVDEEPLTLEELFWSYVAPDDDAN